MFLDERTKRILDFERVLAELHPITPFGQKLKNELKPYCLEEREQLIEELERVDVLKRLIEDQRTVFVEIRTSMRQIKDIRKSIERCISGGVLNLVEFFELKNFTYLAKSISESQKSLHWNIPDKYEVNELQWLEKILDPENTGIKTFYIYDCYSGKLGEVRGRKLLYEQKLDAVRKELINKVESEFSVPVRLSGEITVSRNQPDVVKKLQSCSKLQVASETYMNITYRVKPDEEMLELTKNIEALKDEEALEEAHILENLSGRVAERGREILGAMEAIGEFDMIIAKAYMANAYNGVKPVISEDAKCIIKNGRHPLVETGLRKKGKTFTPVSVSLEKGVTLITGANMGGKTVSLKMLGLLAAMAQYGFLVPAEYMEIGLNDFIFVSAGDEQSIDLGLSTFGAEIQSIKEAVIMADGKGIILVDELARGTNPHEGYAISAAIINYLMNKPSITVITTHFDGLAKPGIKHLQVKGLRNLEFGNIKDPETISEYMDYALVEIKGESSVPKDAINISRLMGIPDEIVSQAEKILENRK
ncbi:MAG: MutS-related protein [Caulobacteraceae bacterium]